MSQPSERTDPWLDGGYFRCLGYTFRLRWKDELTSQPLRRVLAPFQIPSNRVPVRVPPTPNVPPVYSVSGDHLGCTVHYGEAVLFGPEPCDEAFSHLLWHINSEMARLTGSYVLIHAGAVASAGGEGMILPGDSGFGKTTLVGGLVRAGFGYLSDEAAVIDPVSRNLYSYPKPLNLKRGSFALFPDVEAAEGQGAVKLQDQWLVPPGALGGTVAEGPIPVRWIVSIRYQEGSPTRLERVTPGTGVLELSRRTMNLAHYGSRVIPLLADVAREAESYRLVTGDLAEAVATLDKLTVGG